MLYICCFHVNSVQLRHFRCLKSLLWLLCLSLKVVSARPMYFFMSSLTTLVTVACTQVTMLNTLHLRNNFLFPNNYTQTTLFWDLKCSYYEMK